jgi:hypothetical protein
MTALRLEVGSRILKGKGKESLTAALKSMQMLQQFLQERGLCPLPVNKKAAGKKNRWYQ